MGRKPIGDEAMTAAERQARVRALYLERMKEAQIEIEALERNAWDWHKCMLAGRPGATDKDIEDAFADLATRLAGLSILVGMTRVRELDAALSMAP